jgi:hypothetical protein
MNTYDVKNSYSSQATTVNRGREEFVNSIQIDWSWYTPIFYSQSLFKFLPWRQVLKNYPANFTFENSKRCKCFIFKVAIGRWRLSTRATTTGLACQRPNVEIKSSKLVPPRSPKWRLTMLKVLTVPKQQESTVEERSLSTLVKFIGVSNYYPLQSSHFQIFVVAKSFKKITLQICYCDRARLPVTQCSRWSNKFELIPDNKNMFCIIIGNVISYLSIF